MTEGRSSSKMPKPNGSHRSSRFCNEPLFSEKRARDIPRHTPPLLAQFLVRFSDYDCGDDEREEIRERERDEQTVQAPERREQKRKSDSENQFPRKRNQRRGGGFSHRLQVDERSFVHRRKNCHAQVHAEAFYRERRVVRMLVRRTENADELAGEKFHADKRGRADRSFCKKQIREQLLCPVLPSRADIVARDRNASCRAADRNRNDNLEKFHDDSEDGKRNLREFVLRENLVPRAVFRAHVLNRSHRRDKRNLRKEARYAERKEPARDARRQHETARAQANRLHPAQITERKKRGENLPEHRRHRRAHHSPLAHENENRVKDDVHDRA